MQQRSVAPGKLRTVILNLSKNIHQCALSDSDFQEFSQLASSVPSSCIQSCLTELLEQAHLDQEASLALKYHGAACHAFFSMENSRDSVLNSFEDGNNEPHILEGAAVALAKWFQPFKHVKIDKVVQQLDGLAEDAKDILRTRNSAHPLFEESPQQEHFSTSELNTILDSINHALYVKHGFKGNGTDYYNRKNSFIDVVLETKQGNPITLCILYRSVACRLSLDLKPVNAPRHFLLKYQDGATGNIFFIDAFDSGRRIPRSDIHNLLGNVGVNDQALESVNPLPVSTEKQYIYILINGWSFLTLYERKTLQTAGEMTRSPFK